MVQCVPATLLCTVSHSLPFEIILFVVYFCSVVFPVPPCCFHHWLFTSNASII